MVKFIKIAVASVVLVSVVFVELIAPGGTVTVSPATITVDPGHGGVDPGAVVAGITEKQVNLDIALRVAELAEKHPKLNVVLTRSTDRYVHLLDRLELAEKKSSVGYLSIQANSFSDPDVTGIETLVDHTRSRNSPSRHLSSLVQDETISLTHARDRGIKTQRLYTRHTRIPSALIEVGFLTSPVERSKLLRDAYLDRIARGIVKALLIYVSRHVG